LIRASQLLILPLERLQLLSLLAGQPRPTPRGALDLAHPLPQGPVEHPIFAAIEHRSRPTGRDAPPGARPPSGPPAPAPPVSTCRFVPCPHPLKQWGLRIKSISNLSKFDIGDCGPPLPPKSTAQISPRRSSISAPLRRAGGV